MITAPDGLSEGMLSSVLSTHWRLDAATVTYRAVGFGSHHWEVTDTAGERWFATADELRNKRVSASESLDVAFGRLRHALAAAVELRASGFCFVVAPIAARDGAPVVRAADDFAVALYPFVAGQSFEWGAFSSLEHRDRVFDLVVAVHTAPPVASARALAESYAVPHRDQLEAVLALGPGDLPEAGPYTGPMARLLAASKGPIGLLLRRYDELAALARATPPRSVLTHGEPHASNTMLTSQGWQLIDWETALVAPPERDLWHLDPGDSSVLRAYAIATGVRPLPALLELYRVRWDVADLAIDVSRFCWPHKGTAEDKESWQVLSDLVRQLSA